MTTRALDRTDNYDLQIRRKRLGLRQHQVAQMLGFTDQSVVSRFESGERPLPLGLTRRDYERTLDTYEAGLRRQERGR